MLSTGLHLTSKSTRGRITCPILGGATNTGCPASLRLPSSAPKPVMAAARRLRHGYAMANPEHLKLLRQGVTVWNTWRAGNRLILPDLREARKNLGRPRQGEPASGRTSAGRTWGAVLDAVQTSAGRTSPRREPQRGGPQRARGPSARRTLSRDEPSPGRTSLGANLGDANLRRSILVETGFIRGLTVTGCRVLRRISTWGRECSGAGTKPAGTWPSPLTANPRSPSITSRWRSSSISCSTTRRSATSSIRSGARASCCWVGCRRSVGAGTVAR